MEASGHVVVGNPESDGVFAADLHDLVVSRMSGIKLAPPHERIGAVLPGAKTGIVVGSRTLEVSALIRRPGRMSPSFQPAFGSNGTAFASLMIAPGFAGLPMSSARNALAPTFVA